LSEIHRQTEGSAIVTNAQLINQGLMPLGLDEPDLNSEFTFLTSNESEATQQRLFDLVTIDLPAMGYDPRRDIQVLTPMHRGLLGTQALNRGLQQLLRSSDISHTRGDTVFRVGDKVIQTVNDTERDVSNGDIGLITTIDSGERRLVVDFDGRCVAYRFAQLDELSLAWAISIHKAQGSEWPAVVLPVSTDHFKLLERRLLYTGVTRARRKVVLIGQRHALSLAVGNAKSYERLTRLTERIADRVSMVKASKQT
jgi:exodeoxyribonuclease V alpha subunit